MSYWLEIEHPDASAMEICLEPRRIGGKATYAIWAVYERMPAPPSLPLVLTGSDKLTVCLNQLISRWFDFSTNFMWAAGPDLSAQMSLARVLTSRTTDLRVLAFAPPPFSRRHDDLSAGYLSDNSSC
nr:hypothetical protein Iba_chr02fCG10210 [Ipomoea batatas]